MPEAAVHEDRLFSRAKYEIGMSGKIGRVGLRAKAQTPDEAAYRELRFGTARMHGPHDLRALLRRDVIHAGQYSPCSGTSHPTDTGTPTPLSTVSVGNGPRKQLLLSSRSVARDVVPHVLTQHLRGGLSLRAAYLDEFLANLPLDPQPQSGIFGLEWHQ